VRWLSSQGLQRECGLPPCDRERQPEGTEHARTYPTVLLCGLTSQAEVGEKQKSSRRESPPVDADDDPDIGEDAEEGKGNELHSRKVVMSVGPGNPRVERDTDVGDQEVKCKRKEKEHLGGSESHEAEVTADVQARVAGGQKSAELLASFEKSTDG